MDGNQIFMLGLGLQAPWKIVDQHLDTSQKPNQLRVRVSADRGSLFPCPNLSLRTYALMAPANFTMKIELRTRKALHPHRQARFSLAASDELLFFG